MSIVTYSIHNCWNADYHIILIRSISKHSASRHIKRMMEWETKQQKEFKLHCKRIHTKRLRKMVWLSKLYHVAQNSFQLILIEYMFSEFIISSFSIWKIKTNKNVFVDYYDFNYVLIYACFWIIFWLKWELENDETYRFSHFHNIPNPVLIDFNQLINQRTGIEWKYFLQKFFVCYY